MKRKGFTLIELLAVIVLLAIIGLITIPIVTNSTDSARKNTFKSSIIGLIEAANIYYAENVIEYDSEGKMIFECSSDGCKTTTGKELVFKGKSPIAGELIIYEDGVIEAHYLENERYCAFGTKTYLEIKDDCSKLDETDLELIFRSIKERTNEITIYINAVDQESKIKKLEYSISGREDHIEYDLEDSIEEIITFTNLESDTEYEVEVIITAGNGKRKKEKINVSTKKLGTLEIELNDEPSTSVDGYLKNQTATILYDQLDENKSIYVKTTRRADLSGVVTESCGTGVTPDVSNCTNHSPQGLESNIWYRLGSSDMSLIYDENADDVGTIYAAVVEDGNVILTTTAAISKIDNVSPALLLESADVASDSGMLTIKYKMDDSGSGLGLPTCVIGLYGDSDSSASASSNLSSISYTYTGYATTTTCTKSGLTNAIYMYKVCANDRLGNQTCQIGSTDYNKLISAKIDLSTKPNFLKNGYYREQTATIDYNGAINAEYYYIKSSRAAMASSIDGGLVATCGDGIMPSSDCTYVTGCSGGEFHPINSDIWYRYTSVPTVKYDEEADELGSLYAAIGTSDSILTTTSATINKIDRTNPTITLGDATAQINTATINYSLNDDKSGLGTPTCVLGYLTSENQDGSIISSEVVFDVTGKATATECVATNLKPGVEYTYKICVSDAVANGPVCSTGKVTTKTEVTFSGLTGGRYDETGLCNYISNYGTSGRSFSYNGYSNCKFTTYACDMDCDDMGWAGWYGWGDFVWNDGGWWDVWSPAACSGNIKCTG